MKALKRCFALFLTLVMVVSAVPFQAMAEEDCDHDWCVWDDDYNGETHEEECGECYEHRHVPHTYVDGRCTGCGYSIHTHNVEYNSVYDVDRHIGVCTICDGSIKAPHEYVDGACSVCGTCQEHNFALNKDAGRTSEVHMVSCTECGLSIAQAHDWIGNQCSSCGYVIHDCADYYEYIDGDRDDSGHSVHCSFCGENGWENHSFNEEDVCIVCNYEKPACDHYWDTRSVTLETHTIKCWECGETQQAPHTYEDGCCTRCGACENHELEYSCRVDGETEYHEIQCYDCDLRVREDHHFDEEDTCVCGVMNHEHTLSVSFRSDNGHGLSCQTCAYNKYVDHAYGEDGRCTDCGTCERHTLNIVRRNQWYHYGYCPVCDMGSYYDVEDALVEEHTFDEDGICTVCEMQEHDCADNYVYSGDRDEDDHYLHCSLCDSQDYENHEFVDGFCSVCGACEEHTLVVTGHNAYRHWGYCSVCGLGEDGDEDGWGALDEGHSFDENGVCKCGYVQHTHVFPEITNMDPDGHGGKCSICKMGVWENHRYEDGACIVCGFCENEAHVFTYREGDYRTPYGHQGTCTLCGFSHEEWTFEEHTFDEETGLCTVCGFNRNHEHTLVAERIDKWEHYVECTECDYGEWVDHEYVDGFCEVCGACKEDQHTFVYNADRGVEEEGRYHYVKCTVCGVSSWEKHKNDDNGACTVCGYREHNHDFRYTSADSWMGSDYHKAYCTECGFGAVEKHVNDENGVCRVCGYRRHEHAYVYTSEGETYHRGECTICNLYLDGERHTMNDAGVCTECGYAQHEHVPGDRVAYMNAQKHALSCEKCGTGIEADHTYENEVCTVCGYADHEHNLEATDADSYSHSLKCKTCGYKYAQAHNYTDGACAVCGHTECTHAEKVFVNIAPDENKHWVGCTGCPMAFSESHTMVDGVCTVCGYRNHIHAYVYNHGRITNFNHVVICDDCGAESVQPHTFGDNGKCVLCGMSENHEHRYTFEAGTADETWHVRKCEDCGISEIAEHRFVNGVCACGVKSHKHTLSYSGEQSSYEHGMVCSDCGVRILESHDGETCSVCNYHTHEHNYVYKERGEYLDYHVMLCTVCQTTYHALHTMEDGVCTVCNYTKCDHEMVYTVSAKPTAKYHAVAFGTCTKCGETSTINLPRVDEERYTTERTQEPTCTEAGVERVTWNDTTYGELFFENEIPAKGHISRGIAAVEPTCTEAGHGTGVKCSVCDEILTAPEEIPALGHTEETLEAVEPSCTETGLTEGTKCSVCGEVLVAQETVDALGHDYGEGEITQEPTCTETGIKHTTCERCGDGYDEVLAAAGHTEEILEAVAPTCTETGLTEGKKCAVCGEILVEQETVEMIDHSYDEGTVRTEATCTTDGEKVYTCDVCGFEKTETIEHGHKPVETVAKDATCTEDGLMASIVCEACGELLGEQQVIPAKGHSFGEYVVTKEPTCTEKGKKARTCSVCDWIEDEEIEMLEHIPEEMDAVAPSCTETGLTEGTKCAVCGEVLEAQEEIEALGHAEVALEAKDATCTETGLTAGKKCSRCDEILAAQEEIEALGHAEVILEAKDATCTETGLTAGKKCSRCEDILVEQEEIPALNHDYVLDYGTSKIPTCTEKGERILACSRCLDEIKEPVEKMGHSPVHHDQVDATADSTGVKEHWSCEICGKLFADPGCQVETDGVQLEIEAIRVRYTIHFDGNGADSGSMADITCNYADSRTLPVNRFVRANSTFAGWNTSADGSGKSFANEAAVSKLTTDDGAVVTLYAQWAAATYKITYKLDGGENNPENPASYAYGSTVTLQKPTKFGHTFDGWYKESTFKTKVTGFTATDKGAKTVYAKWTKTKYTITYELGGGTNHSDNKTSFYFDTATFDLLKPTRKGCTFDGWYLDANFQQPITQIEKDTTENVTVYAKWIEKEYYITYELKGGENNGENPEIYTVSTVFTLKKPTRTGYTFGGWYTDAECKATKVTKIEANTTGDKTLYAKWSKTKYTVTYELNKGTNNADNKTSFTFTTETFDLLKPKRKGYTFEGWYLDADFQDPVTQIEKGTTHNVTVYAKWSKNTYTITYELKGGVNNDGNPDTYTVTDTIKLAKAKKTGYTFGGWYKDAKYQTKVTEIAKGSTGDMTLYAKWSKTKYTITYNLNKGTNSSKNPAYYYYTSDTITLAKPKRSGYTFVGWFTDSDYTDQITEIPSGSTGKLTLYAKWKKG